ncbi:serine/threonine protein kinase, CMGC, CDC2/CDK subfamily [Diaporthe australafricana]|uniref:Serine/threonine protein kinase, CMGC, CDC2/CDK subfamily n=1 Tax=Diaporthe australafricana TaxID=127596 RepID=A0ABR3W2N1_9PEZI
MNSRNSYLVTSVRLAGTLIKTVSNRKHPTTISLANDSRHNLAMSAPTLGAGAASSPRHFALEHSRPKNSFVGCSRIGDFEVLGKLGEGTFGEVHRARSRKSGALVALKKIIMHNEKDGFPITALREIKLLKLLSHKNVLRLEDMAVEHPARSTDKRKKPVVYMATPYMDHDLSGLLDNPSITFTESQIKCYLVQLLEGLKYLHENKILHRDMKAANLLINNKGILQIADFGLARLYDEPPPVKGRGGGEGRRDYTSLVVTRWYRPPELLLHLKKYTTAIDIWGVGYGQGAVALLRELMRLDWKRRINAIDALEHPYLHTAPLPAQPGELPQMEESHELDRRKFHDRKAALPPAPKGGTVGRGPQPHDGAGNPGFNGNEVYGGRNGMNGGRYPPQTHRNGPGPGERVPAWSRGPHALPPRPPPPADNYGNGGPDMYLDGHRDRDRDRDRDRAPPRNRPVAGRSDVDTYIPTYRERERERERERDRDRDRDRERAPRDRRFRSRSPVAGRVPDREWDYARDRR